MPPQPPSPGDPTGPEPAGTRLAGGEDPGAGSPRDEDAPGRSDLAPAPPAKATGELAEEGAGTPEPGERADPGAGQPPGEATPPAAADDDEGAAGENASGDNAANADEPDEVDEDGARGGASAGERGDSEGGGGDAPEREEKSSDPQDTSGAHGARHAPGGAHAAPEPAPGGWKALGKGLRPHWSKSQVLVGVLCAVLGFALVVQLGQNSRTPYSSMREGDLVRALDDVTARSDELQDQINDLTATRDRLAQEAERQQEAEAQAETDAETQGLLSGRLPAEGPGITIDISSAGPIAASAMVNLLEELRNAGAEVMQVNDTRLVADSYFTDVGGQLTVDGAGLSTPIRWLAIGDPATMETALKIHGGAIETLTADGAQTTVTRHDSVKVTATLTPPDPQYATPTR